MSDELVIDCDTCVMRDVACSDCVVSVLLGPPQALDGTERTALAVLAGSGLVPPLRLVTAQPVNAEGTTSMKGAAEGAA